MRPGTAGVERDRAGAGAGARVTSAAGISDAARALLRVIGGPGGGGGGGAGAGTGGPGGGAGAGTGGTGGPGGWGTRGCCGFNRLLLYSLMMTALWIVICLDIFASVR